MTTKAAQAQAALQLLDQHYQRPPHPLAFSGPLTIYKYFQGALTLQQIKDYLSSVDTYTLHRDVRRSRTFNPTYVYHKRQLLQADLATFHLMGHHNRGYNYLLQVK